MEKVFGFDIGIASIGWSVIESDIPDISDESEKIIEKPDGRIGKIIATLSRCAKTMGYYKKSQWYEKFKN